MKKLLSGIILNLCFLTFAFADNKTNDTNDWVKMPAGAKPAYMGIHGGTMPVSLLISGDGQTLLAFVGRTGNDFLNVLRQTDLALPSFGNGTGTPERQFNMPSSGSSLFAGNATATMPVIPVKSDIFAKEAWFGELIPFGLSEQPLSIEGNVNKPAMLPVQKRARLMLFPNSFQLKRN